MKIQASAFVILLLFLITSCVEQTAALKERKSDGLRSSFLDDSKEEDTRGDIAIKPVEDIQQDDQADEEKDEPKEEPAEEIVQEDSGEEDQEEQASTEQVEGEIYNFAQSSIYLDYNSDSQGFGPWRMEKYKAQSFVNGYTKSAYTRCHNGSTIQVRECFDLANPSKCLGAIEREIKCSDLGLEVPSYSTWTKAVAQGDCVNGKRTYTRQCISLDGLPAKCYGPASFELSCNSESSQLNHITEKFTKTTNCQPSEEAKNHINELCGGWVMTYNGVSLRYTNCYIDEQGQERCPEQEPQVKYCMLPKTICSSSVTDNMVPGSTYANPDPQFSVCGILKGSETDPSAQRGFAQYEDSNDLTKFLGTINGTCGIGNRKVQRRKCEKQNYLPLCLYTLDEVRNQEHRDVSCVGDITKLVSCEYSQYQYNNKDGVWSDWKTVTGCHFNPELQKVVKVQKRECEGTRRAGKYCEGDSTRYQQCAGGVYDGVAAKVLIDSSLAADAGLMNKINQYKSLVQAKGADIDLQIVNTANMQATQLVNLVHNLQNSSGRAPKLVSLVGAFPYLDVALLSNQRFSGNTTQTKSDLPLMLANQAVYSYSNGLFHFDVAYEKEKMEFGRVVFRTDFSNHDLSRAGASSELQKYSLYFDKVIAHHQNGQLKYPTAEVKVSELIDEHWDKSTSTFETTVQLDINSYYGTQQSRRAGFEELFAQKAAYGLLMAHGSGEEIAFMSYGNMPSNGHDIDGNNRLKRNIESEELFNDIAIRVPVMGLFNCYSFSPDHESNVGNSVLLGKNSDVIAAHGAYGSGSMMQWSMIEYSRGFLTGDSIGQALLKWTEHQSFGNSKVKTPSMTYSYNALKWHIPIAFAGDPLARALE